MVGRGDDAMGWNDLLLSDWRSILLWSRQERRLLKSNAASSLATSNLRLEVKELERRLAVLTGVVQYLGEACLKAGVVTKDELDAAADAISAVTTESAGVTAAMPTKGQRPEGRGAAKSRKAAPAAPARRIRRTDRH